MQQRPGAADVWLRASLGRGAGALEGRITTNGERRFYFRYTDPTGVRRRLLIGPYSPREAIGAFTLSQAKRRANEWSAMYTAGTRDLRGHLERERATKEAESEAYLSKLERERRAGEAEFAQRLTVRKLFERWQETELAPRTGPDGKRKGRKDGGESVRQLFEGRVFPTIGNHSITDVRKADFMAILDAARADGRLRTANVLLATLKQMTRFALVREIIERNPLDTVTRRDAGGSEAPRRRVLAADEIKMLAAALPSANMDARSTCAVWLILATAARVSEAMGARWEHIDLKARTWYLPETKSQRDHVVHLSAFAVRQFEEVKRLQLIREERRARRAGEQFDGTLSDWVFPNHRGDSHVDKTTFGKQLADRQKIPDRRLKGRTAAIGTLALPGGRWTAHDLRRTAATMMAELGVPADVIDECLNHVIESLVRRTYIRDRRLKAQAEAFNLLGARLEALT